MSKFVSRVTSGVVTTVTACVVAAGVTFSTATPARAADPVVWWALGGLITLGIVSHGAKKKHTHTVIARYCENPKTGLYHRC